MSTSLGWWLNNFIFIIVDLSAETVSFYHSEFITILTLGLRAKLIFLNNQPCLNI